MQQSSRTEALMKAVLAATVLENPYIPHDPTPKQAAFLLYDGIEALYGGAAGPGKSEALLMAALQYIEVPGYSALLLRRTYTDLVLPDALMDRAERWLRGRLEWDDRAKTWRLPGGGSLTFGYLENEKDKYRYQSSAFQFIGFDELTQFSLTQYLYLFSRLRRLKGANVPLRMRAATNPGGIGHDWVKSRFNIPDVIDFNRIYEHEGRVFIPASLEDNPHLDVEAYLESLERLDPVTREQLRFGRWDVREEGAIFRREWFEIVEDFPHDARCVRFWDLAATEAKAGRDPDFTAGVKMCEKDGIFYVVDVVRTRATPGAVEALIVQTAALDGRECAIRMEQEPGSSGVALIDHYARGPLLGFDFKGVKSTGSKVMRAAPLASAAEAGNVRLVRGPWNAEFLDEIAVFPQGQHDDIVDATAGAFDELSAQARGIFAWYSDT